MVTNASGGVISEQVVMPYRAMLPAGSVFGGDGSFQDPNQSHPSKRYFTSYDRSETAKLDYAVNQHYNAGQGQFTQVDPIGMGAASLEDPQMLNLYALVFSFSFGGYLPQRICLITYA
jgi:hypothetical protein